MKRLLVVVFVAMAIIAIDEPARAQDEGSVGAIVFVDPLTANLTVNPSSVSLNHQAGARSIITNNGPVPVSTTTATLLIDAQAVTIAGGPTRVFTSIAARSSVQAFWRLCGARPGSYLAMVHVTSTDSSGRQFQTETQAVLLEITGKPKKKPSGAC